MEKKAPHKGFGHEDVPRSPNYQEFNLYAGTTGSMAEFDEDSGTMKIIFTETPTFHKMSSHLDHEFDMGTAKFAFVVQKPEQLRLFAKQLNVIAEGFECLLDPEYEYHEELMGRKPFVD